MTLLANIQRMFFAQQRHIFTHFIRVKIVCKKLSGVSARVGEQHVVNKGDRRGSTFDVEQDLTASSLACPQNVLTQNTLEESLRQRDSRYSVESSRPYPGTGGSL